MIAQLISISGRPRAWLLAAVALTSCSQAGESPAQGRSSAPIVSDPGPVRANEFFVPWGTGPGQLGFLPARDQMLPRGPNAVALLPSGDPVVLDSLRKRVLRITADGPVELTTARPDDEAMAVDHDGAVALFSPLRSSVTVRDAQGHMLGDLPIPRELRDVQAIGFGTSRRLTLRTAFQETYELGSPNARLALEVVLSTKREGAAFLPDGHGISAIHSSQGNIELVLQTSNPSSGRSETSRRIAVASDADSARVLGTAGTTACMRIERVGSSPELRVSRSLSCLDTATGRILLDTSLPAPGLYVPRTELAMGGSRPRVALLHPGPDGMTVIMYDIPVETARGGAR